MKNLRIILLAVLLVAVVGMAYWFVLKPNDEKNLAMQAEIADKQAKLRELNQAQGMVGDLETEIQSYDEADAYFKSKLPAEKEMQNVLKGIWVLARQNNLAPKNVKALDRPLKGAAASKASVEFSEQPILLELEGEFHGMYNFLQGIENLPRIVKINQMEMARDDSKKFGQLNAKLQMTIFFEKVKPPTPVAAAAAPKARPAKR